MKFNSRLQSFSSHFPKPRYRVQERDEDLYVVLHPVEKVHKYSLIWLHGVGESADSLKEAFLQEQFKIVPEDCKVILPTAPIIKMTAIKGYEMHAWYDY